MSNGVKAISHLVFGAGPFPYEAVMALDPDRRQRVLVRLAMDAAFLSVAYGCPPEYVDARIVTMRRRVGSTDSLRMVYVDTWRYATLPPPPPRPRSKRRRILWARQRDQYFKAQTDVANARALFGTLFPNGPPPRTLPTPTPVELMSLSPCPDDLVWDEPNISPLTPTSGMAKKRRPTKRHP